MKNARGLLIVLVGPSGSGKGTVLQELLREDSNTMLSISATTRSPREGEIDGKHYHFTKKDTFEQMISDGDMLEYASYCENYYGTPKKQVMERLNDGHNVILEIEMQGAKQIKTLYPDAVLIFITPPSMVTLRQRLTDRGTEEQPVIEKRLATAKRELQFAYECDYVVINDTLESAVAELRAIIESNNSHIHNMRGFIDRLVEESQ